MSVDGYFIEIGKSVIVKRHTRDSEPLMEIHEGETSSDPSKTRYFDLGKLDICWKKGQIEIWLGCVPISLFRPYETGWEMIGFCPLLRD
jgi:hypothetical protein